MWPLQQQQQNNNNENPSSQHSCPSAPEHREISPRPNLGAGECLEASVQFLFLWQLGAGKSLLPCSPFHTSSCDPLHCQYLANRLEMNTFLHRWLSGRTHVHTCLPAPGSIRPGRRCSQDRDSRQCRPSAHLRFLVMRGRDADCERSLADLC